MPSRIINPPARMLVPLHHTPPRWARLYVYRYNRKQYLKSLVDAPSSSLVTIDDLPTEILVRIFWFTLSANDNQYNVALPRVCSRWTRIMYDHVYVQGFRVDNYDDLLSFQLGLFADALAASQYNAVLPKDVCQSVLGRYRLGMHPRVVTYTILRGEDKEGSEHSIHTARATQKFCFNFVRSVLQGLAQRVSGQPHDLYIRAGVYSAPLWQFEESIAGGSRNQIHQSAQHQAPRRCREVRPGERHRVARVCPVHQGFIGDGAPTDRRETNVFVLWGGTDSKH